MLKRIVLLTTLALGLAAATAAAQTAGDAAARPGAQRLLRNFQARVQRGVRSGRITPDELTRLRTQARALRDRVRTLRQRGTPPTLEERRQVRQDARRLNRDIVMANRRRAR
jgi:Spy/CpxP family protein refolding chaperone